MKSMSTLILHLAILFEVDTGKELEEVFKALKIKRPQFDVKECIPTDIEVF